MQATCRRQSYLIWSRRPRVRTSVLVPRARSMKRTTTRASTVCPAGSRSRRATYDVSHHALPIVSHDLLKVLKAR